MSPKTDLRALVDNFVSELEAAIEQRVQEEFARKFDELRSELFAGTSLSPASESSAPSATPVPGRRPSDKAAAGRTPRKRGGRRQVAVSSRRGRPAEQRPCPVSGVLNSARRFSYLMPEHRTPENLAKYRGWSRQQVEEKLEADKREREAGSDS